MHRTRRAVGPRAAGHHQSPAPTEAPRFDGFNLVYAPTPGLFADFVDLVVPELRSRGRIPAPSGDATLRERLHGAAGTRDRGTLMLRERSHSPSALACASSRSVEAAPVPSSSSDEEVDRAQVGEFVA
ncbi:hypothetical protein AB0478_46515 [Streptomyces sp. NPDC051917]|uniref:hypothetical protein n=1 Tax=Streptomyces sp. NPDC051917 TaxID=3154754 RepID=UPI0034521E23